jgi:hypothetical protein
MTEQELYWSKRLESVRKDVECFFGILKGRFRILKLPLQYHTVDRVDSVFFSCCVLHNMLHAFDGLDVFERDVQWSGPDGWHEAWRALPNVDFGAAGSAPDNEGGTGEVDVEEVESTFHSLRGKLIQHFNRVLAEKGVAWLRS